MTTPLNELAAISSVETRHGKPQPLRFIHLYLSTKMFKAEKPSISLHTFDVRQLSR